MKHFYPFRQLLGLLLLGAPFGVVAQHVGIGTSSPTAPLEVAGAVTENVYNGGYSANLITAGSLSSSSGSGVTNLVDNDPSTRWIAGSTTMPQWVQADLTTTTVVRRYRMYFGGAFGNNPGQWQLQGSTDASTWTAVHTVSSEANTVGYHDFFLSNTTGYRYYRLNMTALMDPSSGSPTTFREWEMYSESSSPGGVALRLPAGTVQLGGLAGGAGVRLLGLNSDGTVFGVPSTPVGQGDNFGNHTATATILGRSGDGDKLVLNSDYGSNGPKLSSTASSVVLSAGTGLTSGGGASAGDFIVNLTAAPAGGFYEAARFTGVGGRLGLATGTPNTRLSISPGTTEAKITLWDGGSSSTHYGLGISSSQFNYHIDGSAASHVFYAGGKNGDGTELMRIKGNGNVGIGINPSFKLDVNGAARAGSYTFTAPSGDPAPVITTRTVPAGQGEANEKTELILFHSNDNANGAGPDLITLRAPAIRLQTYNDATVADINNAAGSVDQLTISPTGAVAVTNLAGSGSRPVLADASGTLVPTTGGSAFARLVGAQAGTATLGGGSNGYANYTVNFPTAFAAAPAQLICTVRTEDGQSWGDTFCVTTKTITATSFQLNVKRVDNGNSWGQNLLLDWIAIP